jgi:RNA polymerase sigma factor (sigma-70 family)
MSRQMAGVEESQPGGRPRAEGELDVPEFESLFRDCAGDLHGYVHSLLGDRASAEDVTALAFERLYSSRARLDRRRGSTRGWLFTIARNAALDELRRRRRQQAHLTATEPHDDDAALDFAERAEQRASLRSALLALPLHEREIVLLKFHGQLTNVELARVLGISESNAGTRVHRALLALRKQCSQLGVEEVA